MKYSKWLHWKATLVSNLKALTSYRSLGPLLQVLPLSLPSSRPLQNLCFLFLTSESLKLCFIVHGRIWLPAFTLEPHSVHKKLDFLLFSSSLHSSSLSQINPTSTRCHQFQVQVVFFTSRRDQKQKSTPPLSPWTNFLFHRLCQRTHS